VVSAVLSAMVPAGRAAALGVVAALDVVQDARV
jgi:hypothetical protein